MENLDESQYNISVSSVEINSNTNLTGSNQMWTPNVTEHNSYFEVSIKTQDSELNCIQGVTFELLGVDNYTIDIHIRSSDAISYIENFKSVSII